MVHASMNLWCQIRELTQRVMASEGRCSAHGEGPCDARAHPGSDFVGESSDAARHGTTRITTEHRRHSRDALGELPQLAGALGLPRVSRHLRQTACMKWSKKKGMEPESL